MQRFHYKAINDNGRYVSGVLSAENQAELLTLVRETGCELISYKIEKQGAKHFVGKVQAKDLIAIFVHLEQFDRAGVSIVDSLNDLKNTTDSPKISNLMTEMYEAIKNGSLFSESLAKHRDIFNSVYIGLIQNGEKTGNLSEAFKSITDDLKWTMDLKRKTRKAIAGPVFGLIVMFIVLGVMTTVVVPKVTGFLRTQELSLPTMTVALIGFSSFLQNYWYLIILFGIATWGAIKLAERSPEMAVRIDDLKLKIPLFGPIMTKIDLAKFCQFFAITFKGGLGVLECLDAASSVVKNRAIKRSVIIVKQQVSDGQSLAKAIALAGYFPNLVVSMFKIGEESGNMESSLRNVKFFYDREISDSIDRIVGMIQPTLTIVMGGMIMWITLAVFGPIYGSFSQVH